VFLRGTSELSFHNDMHKLLWLNFLIPTAVLNLVYGDIVLWNCFTEYSNYYSHYLLLNVVDRHQ